MKKLLMVLLAALLMTGCAQKIEESTINDTSEFTDASYVVDAAWLKDNLDEVMIIDARGQKAFDEGHIPNAVPAMWQGFSNMDGAPGEDTWGTVLEKEALSKALAALGVSKDKTIVVYADTTNGWGEDGRLVWMLRNAGLDQAKILDGGIGYWTAQGYDISKEAATLEPTTFAVENYNTETTITTKALAENLSSYKVIDVREADEFDGAAKFGEARGGHLPNSIQLTFNNFIQADGTLKSADEIQKILDEKGLKKEDKIVTYCTAGIRSAHMQVVLAMLGYETVMNYDSSFYAWAADESLPLE